MIEYFKAHSDVASACISAIAAIVVGIIGAIFMKNKRDKSLSQSAKNVKNSIVNQSGGNVKINGNCSLNNNNSHK